MLSRHVHSYSVMYNFHVKRKTPKLLPVLPTRLLSRCAENDTDIVRWRLAANGVTAHHPTLGTETIPVIRVHVTVTTRILLSYLVSWGNAFRCHIDTLGGIRTHHVSRFVAECFIQLNYEGVIYNLIHYLSRAGRHGVEPRASGFGDLSVQPGRDPIYFFIAFLTSLSAKDSISLAPVDFCKPSVGEKPILPSG
jgi:hypothetical protein